MCRLVAGCDWSDKTQENPVDFLPPPLLINFYRKYTRESAKTQRQGFINRERSDKYCSLELRAAEGHAAEDKWPVRSLVSTQWTVLEKAGGGDNWAD